MTESNKEERRLIAYLGRDVATHTPGPWRAEGQMVLEPNTGNVIAGPGRNFGLINPSQTLNANARLIAAAIPLLDVVKRIYALDRDTGHVTGPVWRDLVSDIAVDAARALDVCGLVKR